MTRRDRIRRKILARVQIEDGPLDTPCWIWTGPTSGETGRGSGYARMSLDGQTVAVHLVFWTNEHGFIPGRKQLDHLCRRRLCVNPNHLELVTHKQNQKRKSKGTTDAKGRSQSQIPERSFLPALYEPEFRSDGKPWLRDPRQPCDQEGAPLRRLPQALCDNGTARGSAAESLPDVMPIYCN